MRVLHVVRPAAGGMVRQVASLVVDPRFECLVAAPLKVLKHPDLKPCAVLALEGTPGGIAQLRSAIRVAELVRGSGVQCIHAHGLLRFPTVAIAARLARRPWVATLHNLLPGEIGSVRRRGLRLLLGSAARVLAVSDAVAASAAGVVATSRMEVVRNGIDAAPFLNAPSRTEARAGLGWNVSLPVVLAVSRLAPEKGLDLLGPIARSPKVRVVVAGDGPERERLKQLGLELLGNRDDIPLLLAASDVVVVPSRSEGLGLAAIEALAAGRPVVASAVGGLPEVVDPQVGVLVESENPEAIAREVRRLIEDPELRERLGAAGRAKALSHFDLETMRAATLRAYRRAVKCE